MNRMQFIQTIMELYPNTFKPDNEKQFKGWVNRYKKALPEDWDFDKLLMFFDTKWQSTVVPPHPSFFLEFKNDVRPERKRIQKVVPISQEQKEANMQKFKEFGEKLRKLVEENKIID